MEPCKKWPLPKPQYCNWRNHPIGCPTQFNLEIACNMFLQNGGINLQDSTVSQSRRTQCIHVSLLSGSLYETKTFLDHRNSATSISYSSRLEFAADLHCVSFLSGKECHVSVFKIY